MTLQWEKQYNCWHNRIGSEVGQPSPGNVKIRTVIVACWRYLKRCFGTVDNILKAMNLNGAFCRYLIRYFDLQRNFWKQCVKMVHSDAVWYDILTCIENFQNKKAKWCILTLFENRSQRRMLGTWIR